MDNKKTINVLDYWDGRYDEQGNYLIADALNAAIKAAQGQGEGIVYFPEGTYNNTKPDYDDTIVI